jgi:hypothetical protein
MKMTSIVVMFAVALASAEARAESYWKPAVICNDSKGGEMVIDADLANRYNVQLVIHNREIIDYLTRGIAYAPYGYVRHGETTATVAGSVKNPIFHGGQFRGFELQGIIGNAWGTWAAGTNVYRSGSDLVVETVNNYYDVCHAYQGIECMSWESHPREVVRNWIFTGCIDLAP